MFFLLLLLLLKIVDWEYAELYNVVRRTERNQSRVSSDKSVLYFLCDDDSGQPPSTFRHLAPEIQKNGRLEEPKIQKNGRLDEPTRAGDVYSFGVVIHDLFVGISGHEQHDTEALSTVPFKARQLMELACDKAAVKRPTFDQLEKSLRCIGRKTNLLERCVDPSISAE